MLVGKTGRAEEAGYLEGSSAGVTIAHGGHAKERFEDDSHLFSLNEGMYDEDISWGLGCGGEDQLT